MGKLVISHVGKAYKSYANKWARIREWVTGRPQQEQIWVLRDIHFTVNPGEAVGIVGVNGAGKSTLLKIITGTTQPTCGSVHIEGRVAALLELGIGFHPDFTGRQNVLMAGQLLGYGVDEIARLMPEIEAFAGIGEYIDRPVRVYSSGMQVRLAFAVATAARPDVLIVDEALSVGDAAFQRKCFQRIEAYRAAGTTLLLVSHDIETVKKLCDRALFIKQGALAQWGPAKQVCDEYERFLFGDRKSESQAKPTPELAPLAPAAHFDPALAASCEMVYGNGKAEIEACWLADASGLRINVVESGISFRWCYSVRFHESVDKPIFAMMLKTLEGVALYGIDSTAMEPAIATCRAGETIQVEFALANPLAPGVYYLNCGVRVDGKDGVEFLSRRVDSALLRVTTGKNSTVMTGLLEMQAKLTMFESHGSGV